MECPYDGNNELGFVKWYEVPGENIVKVSKIDRKLGRVRLRWHRNDGIFGHLSISNKYVLIPAGSVKEVVHFVGRAFEHPHLHPSGGRKVGTDRMFSGGASRVFEMHFFNGIFNHENERTISIWN